MNNNDDKERWETFCKLYDKLSSKEEMRELFEEEIKCFSLYLSHVNQDYVYNATFLPQFKDDFWNFLCAFNKKYKIVEKLFDVAEKYYNVTLKIDRYWMMTVDEKGKIKKSTLSGVDYICEKEMMIECSILYNLKRNGSKHLYFYTLHNQEHAIVLIQNIVKLIHAIDFLKISAIDYYILFLACYLHDISMVKIPALDSFLTDTNEADELAQELLRMIRYPRNSIIWAV